mmetsp:Transcript_70225/g.157222  ORF Transcript_70225/g.157222 Transcript_70225/m.157222 type:complete len:205 (+) Transcript_70225:561-1175(+)
MWLTIRFESYISVARSMDLAGPFNRMQPMTNSWMLISPELSRSSRRKRPLALSISMPIELRWALILLSDRRSSNSERFMEPDLSRSANSNIAVISCSAALVLWSCSWITSSLSLCALFMALSTKMPVMMFSSANVVKNVKKLRTNPCRALMSMSGAPISPQLMPPETAWYSVYMARSRLPNISRSSCRLARPPSSAGGGAASRW